MLTTQRQWQQCEGRNAADVSMDCVQERLDHRSTLLDAGDNRSSDPFAPTAPGILLLYPGESLKNQIGLWTWRHPERWTETSFEHSLPEIHARLQEAGAVLVDATEDPAQATDAFLQAVVRRGARAVIMYTEVMHDGLELCVRVVGSLFFAGPLDDEQWDDLFDHLLQPQKTMPASLACLGSA